MFNQNVSRLVAPLLLTLILGLAAGLRFYNLNWDSGLFAHPDERSTVAFYAPSIRWPANTGDLFDPRASTLNPFWDVTANARRSYTYGHFPLYTLVLTNSLLSQLAPLARSVSLPETWVQFLVTAQSSQAYALVGRALAALADLASVYLIFLIGRRLYGVWGGLLAAALSTFTVLQIQLAHFFAVDPISTTFTLLAIYGSILLYDRRSLGAALVTGLGIGLAVASKFSALPVVAVPVIAGYLASRQPSTNQQRQSATIPQRYQTGTMVSLVTIALVTSFLVFAVTSPFVLLDFENFKIAVLDEQGAMVSGVADLPFTRQYRGTTAYWYFIEEQVRWGMFWPLGLLALAGTLGVVIKAVLGRAKVGELLGLTWLVVYFGPTGLFLAKFMRYMMPVAPLLTLFGAGLVVALWRLGATAKPSPLPQSGALGKLTRSNEPSTTPPLPPSPPSASLREIPPPLQSSNPPPLRLHPGQAFHLSNLPPFPSSTLPKLTAALLAAIALGGSIIWSLAFVNGVYRTEHPWLTFSRWIYDHVPPGSCLAVEHWDDSLPVAIPDQPELRPQALAYRQPQLPMYEEDTAEKYELLRNTLMDCDYVVLATNRLWRTIPKLPDRYPMSVRYYEALFSGELGFEQVHTVETPPRLGPLVFYDQAADESFTVYDHPQPRLFQKKRQLSLTEWEALLGGTWQNAVAWDIGPPTLLMRLRGFEPVASSFPLPAEGEAQKSLMLDRPVDELPVVDDFRWNNVANNSTLVAVVLWWLVVLVIGLISLPLTLQLLHKLPDRGYALSKALGLLLISYFVWINGSLVGSVWLGNTLPTAWLGLVILTLIGLLVFVRSRQTLMPFIRQNRLLLLTTEALFGLIYLIFVYLRLLNPDLWHPWLGGEKMLEIGFLNAIVKSAAMPPYDPFFAGGIINYYYYGLFIVGVLIKLTGIRPEIAFNLAVPTLAALTAVNAFSLAGNLAASWFRPTLTPAALRLRILPTGLLAVLFVVFMSNLEGAFQFLRNLANVGPGEFQTAIPGVNTLLMAVAGLWQLFNGGIIATYNYWDPSRVIPATINEFPFFSFLFADLHPHMIGIPFTLLFLSLAYNWLRPGSQELGIRNQELGLARERLTNPAPPFNPSGQLTISNEPLTSPSLPPSTPLDLQSSNPPVFHSSIPSASLRTSLPFFHSSIFSLFRWLALPFVLGAIAAINTWDLPTYFGLMLATFVLSRYRNLDGPLNLPRAFWLLGHGGALAALLLVVTYALYAPFFLNYQAPAETGLGLVYTQTDLGQHLKIWGFFIFSLGSWLWLSLLYPGTRSGLLRTVSLFLRRWNVWPHLTEIYQVLVRSRVGNRPLMAWGIGMLLLLTVLLFLLGYRVPAYLLPLVAVALGLLFRRETSAATAFLGLLVFTGLLVLLGVEFFFLRDFLGGEYYRMNTLFKFFIQVWVIFGLATAVIFPLVWHDSMRWSLTKAMIWRSLAMLLLVAGLVYPVLGARTRIDDRFPGAANRPPLSTLDGLAYMTVGVFEWPAGNPIELQYDYEAIRWLQENVAGTPIVAEAKVGYYREGGMRVAAYTGLPSILGGLHQNEQRYPWQIGDRDFVVNELWTTIDSERTLQLIDQLGISYIYLGQVERATYGPFVGDKFEQLQARGDLEQVYENEQTKIYHRLND